MIKYLFVSSITLLAGIHIGSTFSTPEKVVIEKDVSKNCPRSEPQQIVCSPSEPNGPQVADGKRFAFRHPASRSTYDEEFIFKYQLLGPGKNHEEKEDLLFSAMESKIISNKTISALVKDELLYFINSGDTENQSFYQSITHTILKKENKDEIIQDLRKLLTEEKVSYERVEIVFEWFR